MAVRLFTGNKIDDAMILECRSRELQWKMLEMLRKNKDDYLCYLELHIEQGDKQRISASQSGIVAILRYKVRMAGKGKSVPEAPMRLRDDALEKACLSITDLFERVRRKAIQW